MCVPSSPVILNSVSFRAPGGLKIGVVGRTGAGKSSLANALFRIVELRSGRIRIDNVDIATLGLETLRKAMTMIPQDPALFAGTIRDNLDPFRQYSESEIVAAADAFGLRELVGGLEDSVAELGENISSGQKQV